MALRRGDIAAMEIIVRFYVLWQVGPVPTSSFQHGDVGVVGSSESSSDRLIFCFFDAPTPDTIFFSVFSPRHGSDGVVTTF